MFCNNFTLKNKIWKYIKNCMDFHIRQWGAGCKFIILKSPFQLPSRGKKTGRRLIKYNMDQYKKHKHYYVYIAPQNVEYEKVKKNMNHHIAYEKFTNIPTKTKMWNEIIFLRKSFLTNHTFTLFYTPIRWSMQCLPRRPFLP